MTNDKTQKEPGQTAFTAFQEPRTPRERITWEELHEWPAEIAQWAAAEAAVKAPLEARIADLLTYVSELEEYKWKYEDLCR